MSGRLVPTVDWWTTEWVLPAQLAVELAVKVCRQSLHEHAQLCQRYLGPKPAPVCEPEPIHLSIPMHRLEAEMGDRVPQSLYKPPECSRRIHLLTRGTGTADRAERLNAIRCDSPLRERFEAVF